MSRSLSHYCHNIIQQNNIFFLIHIRSVNGMFRGRRPSISLNTQRESVDADVGVEPTTTWLVEGRRRRLRRLRRLRCEAALRSIFQRSLP